jgi:hypothetical protein
MERSLLRLRIATRLLSLWLERQLLIRKTRVLIPCEDRRLGALTEGVTTQFVFATTLSKEN